MKFLIPFFMIFTGCAGLRVKNIGDMRGWHYQLQGYKDTFRERLLAEEKLFVVDPDEIKMTKIPQHKGIILSYLSIGEAENYREYFGNLSKDLILYENKNWKGNFKVKFWEPEWQKIILDKLTTIIKSGYDGVYLDIVDAFYEIKPHKEKAAQMRDFLKKISIHSKKLNPRFKIVQQNAPTLYEYLPEEEREEYFTLIDGIAFEDCFFYGDKEMDNEFNPQDYCLQSMNEFFKREKFVLNVEYLSNPKLIEIYKKRAESLSRDQTFFSLVAPRALNSY